jgi:hypothetical protein
LKYSELIRILLHKTAGTDLKVWGRSFVDGFIVKSNFGFVISELVLGFTLLYKVTPKFTGKNFVTNV